MDSKGIVVFAFLLLLLSEQSLGQSFIYHTADTMIGMARPGARWGKFDIGRCVDSTMYIYRGFGYSDLTVFPDKKIYTYYDNYGARLKGIGEILSSFAIQTYVYGYEIPDDVKAIGCDGEGLIYFAGKGLFSYRPNSNVRIVNYLGDFPPGMQAMGDLTLRAGKLYMSTVSNTLIEVNTSNPISSQVFMTFPPGVPPIHGMITIPGDCDNATTYVIGTDASGSIIYELDFDSKSLTELCRVGFRIMGAGTFEECALSRCGVFLDLDKNNSSGGTRNDFRPTSVCNAPVYIADQDLEVYAEEAIDSVVITLNGILDVGLESLTAASASNLSVSGSGTAKIKIVNLGIASVVDFQQVLTRIFYKNSSAIPTNGNREVWVRGYTRSYVSEVATTKIQIKNDLALEQDSISLKCYGDAGIDFTIRAKGGVAPYRHRWENGDSTATRANLMVGNYPINITDQGGCQLMDTIWVIQPPKSEIELIPNGTLCVGGTLKIDASPGFAGYQWSNGRQTPSITIDEPGQYAVTVTNATGCSDTASIKILESNIEAVISQSDPTCFGSKDGQIVIDSVVGGNSPFLYRLNNNVAQPIKQFQHLSAGTYQVEVEDNNGCLVQTTVRLTEPAPLTLAFGDDTALRLGDSLVLSAQTNAVDPLIQWNPAAGLSCATCLSTVAKPLESIRYEATLTDKSGCTAKNAIFIRVNPHANVYIPNAFSPNGDGVNDVFTVFADGSVERIAFLRVFDRWGNLVFEAKDVVPGDTEEGWDGAFNGKVMPMGTYLYVLQMERIDGVVEQVQGEVLLVR